MNTAKSTTVEILSTSKGPVQLGTPSPSTTVEILSTSKGTKSRVKWEGIYNSRNS